MPFDIYNLCYLLDLTTFLHLVNGEEVILFEKFTQISIQKFGSSFSRRVIFWQFKNKKQKHSQSNFSEPGAWQSFITG